MALQHPSDAAHLVVLRHIVESLRTQLVDRLQVSTESELRELELWPPRDLPYETWSTGLTSVAMRLHPELSEEDALEQLGRYLMRGMSEHVVMRGLLLGLRVMGARRTLLQSGSTVSRAVRGLTITSNSRGPTEVQLVFSHGGSQPTLLRGFFLELLAHLQVKDAHIACLQLPTGQVALDVHWSA